METPALERRQIAAEMQKRNLLGGVAAYLALVPLPMILMGYWQLAGVLILLCAVYLALNPSTLAPTRADVEEVIRDGDPFPQTKSVYVNGQHSGEFVITDPAGQAASDGLYGDLVGQDASVLSPDAQLYGQMHSRQQM